MGALQDSFIASARRQRQATAVVEPGKGSITYGDLDALSDRLRDRLASLGVGPGDRVGFYVRKSIDSVATILGTLKTGAAYVGRPECPCGARHVHPAQRAVSRRRRGGARRSSAPARRAGRRRRCFRSMARLTPAPGLREALDGDRAASWRRRSQATGKPKDLATSCTRRARQASPRRDVSHEMPWASSTGARVFADGRRPLLVTRSVRLRSLHPRHPRLPEARGDAGADRRDLGKDAPRLASSSPTSGSRSGTRRHRSWRSSRSTKPPSRDYSHLKQVLFAGEVFAVKHLRTLCELLPKPRYCNLTARPRPMSARTMK